MATKTRIPTPDHRSVFITAPGGAVFRAEARHAEAVADRLTRFIPHWAISHIEKGDYWVVTTKYAETARAVLLVTTGSVFRLWSPSYPDALARLARYGRTTATPRDMPGLVAS